MTDERQAALAALADRALRPHVARARVDTHRGLGRMSASCVRLRLRGSRNPRRPRSRWLDAGATRTDLRRWHVAHAGKHLTDDHRGPDRACTCGMSAATRGATGHDATDAGAAVVRPPWRRAWRLGLTRPIGEHLRGLRTPTSTVLTHRGRGRDARRGAIRLAGRSRRDHRTAG